MANPNVQPIYPKNIIYWKAKLIAQVTPRIITTETPVLLGTVGDNGCLIHAIDIRHLGDNVATVVRLYSKLAGDTEYFLENELTLAATSSSNNTTAIAPVSFTLPAILPSVNTGMHLEGGVSLYCSLGTAIASGIIVTVRGGDY